ncbi:MAG: hypothetical protein ACLP6E_13625 [Acidimicrobiales bacterium]
MKAKLATFFKKRSVIVSTVVIVVLAVTVVTDLPTNSTIASQISGDKAVIQEVNADVGPCAYAAKESFQIYGDEQSHSLTQADIAAVPGLLRDDQTACSFTSESIYELSSDIEVPGSASGKPIGEMVGTVTLWATSDALSAIESIQTLSGDLGDKSALSQLRSAEGLLASDRAEVESEMEAADKVVGTKLPVVALPALPDPASTQGS